jgi:hypothetical protein
VRLGCHSFLGLVDDRFALISQKLRTKVRRIILQRLVSEGFGPTLHPNLEPLDLRRSTNVYQGLMTVLPLCFTAA